MRRRFLDDYDELLSDDNKKQNECNNEEKPKENSTCSSYSCWPSGVRLINPDDDLIWD